MSSPRAGLTSLRQGLVALVAAAALASWLHLAAAAFRREVLGIFSWKWWLRDQLFYLGPGYLLLFAAIGVLPIACHARWPGRFSWPALVAMLTGFSAFCMLLVFEHVIWQAWLVVAVGVAVQVHRWAALDPARSWRWTWRLALVGQLAIAVSVGASALVGRAAEARAVASLPEARPGAPNVLLLVMDTERAGGMSLYGAPQPTTPYQARLAEGGVVFEAAYSTAPWTLPSHASMFTGQYPGLTGADHLVPLDDRLPTLAEAFAEHGYRTGGFVANTNYAGFATGLARGFQRYQDSDPSFRQILLSTTPTQSTSVVRAVNLWQRAHWISGTLRALWPLRVRQWSSRMAHGTRDAEQITRELLAWLPPRPERPFFAFLNMIDAHHPYLPPPKYRTMFDPRANPRGRYLGAIRYLDDTLKDLLEELDRRQLLDHTIVVITADHGELFGEHGLIGHGNDLVRPLLHVPLLILNAPGAVPGTRVGQAVSLRDLAATLLDLAGVPNREGLGGTSLRPLIAGADHWPGVSPALAELTADRREGEDGGKVPYSLVSLMDDSIHLIASASGDLRVFALPVDTAEARNLATEPGVDASVVEQLVEILDHEGVAWPDGSRQ